MKKYIPLIFAILTFIFTFLVNENVYLFGDDYYYIGFSQGDVAEYFARNAAHYTTMNGRAIVHLLVTFFLSIDMIWWKLLNSFMLACITYFGTKIIPTHTLYSGLAFFLFTCSLGIALSRECIYWLTGSFNYVYPLFMLFIYWYALLKYRENKKHSTLMCILAFFSSATVEQGGMMAFGLTLLLFARDYFVDKKIDKERIFILCSSIIGIASVLLSPATFVRYQAENQERLSIGESAINLAKYLANAFLLSKWMLPLNISFILLACKKIKEFNKSRALQISLLISIPIFIYASYEVTSTSYFEIDKILAVIYLIYAYITPVVLICINEFKHIKDLPMTFTIATILLVGSQIMMVISSVYGMRNILFGVYMLILITAYLAQSMDLTKFSIKSCIGYLTILGIAYISISNQLSIVKGYRLSKEVENSNIEKIKDNTSSELVLQKPDITYTWSMPYVSEYHKYYYIKYYHLENVNVTWK